MVHGLVYSSVVVDEDLIVAGERNDGNAEIVDVTKLKRIVGVIIGIVILKNCCNGVAPSITAAS